MSRTIIANAITACADLAAASEHESLVQIVTRAPDKSQYTLFNPTPIDLRRAQRAGLQRVHRFRLSLLTSSGRMAMT
jgi:hypothetical protein